MFVNVGSFADPPEAEGCAHFLEHMIFMGVDSPKYSNSENLYDSFISSRGGSCNAMTEGEYTVYQFDIAEEHFVPALDIFACCFKSPLLSQSAADREIKSIESEFSLARTSDGARLQQLMCDSATDGHVLRKFSWGNTKSLSTVPKANKVDIHGIVKTFYRKHYVPSAMKLVVMAPKGLEELEKDVRASFNDWVVLPEPPVVIDKEKGKRKRGPDPENIGVKLLSLEESMNGMMGRSPFPEDKKCYVTR
jgi:nardilysin